MFQRRWGHMKMGLLCISRGGRGRGGLALGCRRWAQPAWPCHSPAAMETQAATRREGSGGDLTPPPHSPVSRAQTVLRGGKGFPILPKARSEGALQDGPSRAGAATLIQAQAPVQKWARWCGRRELGNPSRHVRLNAGQVAREGENGSGPIPTMGG